MAQAGDGDAGREIEVMLAVLVPQVQAECAYRHHRGRGVGRDEDLVKRLASDGAGGDTGIELCIHGDFLKKWAARLQQPLRDGPL
jgi:hypothetical protein